MNGLAELGLALVGGAGGGLAVVAWLGKKLISQMLDREMANHKANLDRQLASHEAQLRAAVELEIERVRAVGAISKIEHEVMFRRLQDRRANIIAALYGKLAYAARMTNEYVGTHSSERSPETIAAQKAAIDANRDILFYMDKQKIWLPKECCEKVDAFTGELINIAVTRQVFNLERHGTENFYEQRSNELLRIWDAVQKKVPAALEALAQEFRILVDPRLSAAPKAP